MRYAAQRKRARDWAVEHGFVGTPSAWIAKAREAGVLPLAPQYDVPFSKVQLFPQRLADPLKWRKPARIFVNSMSDLFHQDVPDEFIDRVFATMALCPQHTFQILTKRPERMREYLAPEMRKADVEIAIWQTGRTPRESTIAQWPLPNCWMGVSVEDQGTADLRIPLLLQTPAAVRFASYEPALGPVDFRAWLHDSTCLMDEEIPFCICSEPREVALDLVIVGGESGKGARPFDLAWARTTIAQCRAAGVSCFVKQIGAVPLWDGCGLVANNPPGPVEKHYEFEGRYLLRLKLRDRHGGNPEEWPEDIKVRELPGFNRGER